MQFNTKILLSGINDARKINQDNLYTYLMGVKGEIDYLLEAEEIPELQDISDVIDTYLSVHEQSGSERV